MLIEGRSDFQQTLSTMPAGMEIYTRVDAWLRSVKKSGSQTCSKSRII